MARSRKKKKCIKSGRSTYFLFKVYGTGLLVAAFAFFYFLFFSSNMNIRSRYCYFYVPEYATVTSVYESLSEKKLLNSSVSMWLTMKMMTIHAPRKGLYKLEKGWGNFTIINQLNTARLRPYYNYTVPSYKIRSNVTKSVCTSAGVDFEEFNTLLNDSSFLLKMGNLSIESVYCIFIPGSYRIFEKCTAEDLLESIYSEYSLFWNEERSSAASELGYSPEQLTILASIVYAETKNVSEMPLIAGLYLNRLKKNMRLEADPTLVYATGNYGARRIYRKSTSHPSKYNTYRYKGLPPGPVGPVSVASVEAVLHPAMHDYIFFCASDSLAGCHIFAETFETHKANADRYRKMLDKNKIR